MTITINVSGPVYVNGTPCPRFRWHVGPVVLKRNTMPLEVSMSTEQQVRLHIAPESLGGTPARIDGPATFTVQDGTCTIDPIDDTSAWAVAGDSPGDSIILVSADADLGAGVQTIEDAVTIHVANPLAARLGLSADPPELKA